MHPSLSDPFPSASLHLPIHSSLSPEPSSLLTRRRLLPLDPAPAPSSTSLFPIPAPSPTDARRREREREAQRNLMDAHRETLRAAERTISLLREQIRLHDERARLSIASLVPLPAPADTPARTPTQRAALERSLSSRIASLQADIEREQIRAGLGGLMRRPETEALVEGRTGRSRSASVFSPAACPLVAPDELRPPLDDWLPREGLELPSSPGPFSRRRSASASGSLASMEREWDRQLADGEVDPDGMPILRAPKPSKPIKTIRRASIARPETTHIGRRKVDGLGLQLALVSNRACLDGEEPVFAYQPVCLR